MRKHLPRVVKDGGCKAKRTIIGVTYECQRPKRHTGKHRVGSGSWT